jgi:hypothetical protein
MSLSILVEQLRIALPSLFGIWLLFPTPCLIQANKMQERRQRKGPFMAVLAFKVGGFSSSNSKKAWSSFLFMFNVLHALRISNRLFKRLPVLALQLTTGNPQLRIIYFCTILKKKSAIFLSQPGCH